MPDTPVSSLVTVLRRKAGSRCVDLLLGGLLAMGAGSLAEARPFVAGTERARGEPGSFAGRVLITELGCTACHEGGPALDPKRGPDLSQIGARARFDHLLKFIADPSGTKPGTTMPDLLGRLSEAEREQAARALAVYLSSSATTQPEFESIPAAAAERGRALYHSVGCVACHSPETELTDSQPLGPITEKYSLASLTAFLQDPLAVRPSGRMPDLKLEPHEASDIASYLLRDQVASAPASNGQPGLVERGQKLFAELRCVACHALGDQPVVPPAMPLEQLRADRLSEGCLSGRAGAWPDYSLGPDQRSAIQAALKVTEQPTAEEEIRVILAQFNCVACHERGGFGGVTESRDAYFATRDPNLGEQGRLPPPLTGVGAKLRPDWMRKVLVQGARSRPYCDTRMPAFGAGSVTRVLELWSETDRLPAVPAIPFEDENDFKRIGRELAGTDGLSCVSCHTFKDQQTGAMGSLDMTLMAQRVTRDWFHHYLAEPQRFNPSTVMPGFWSAGQSPKPDVLDGDRDRQIEALWRYLSDGYSTDAPKGVRREPMQLLASADEAVMLRRSYPGVGKRGIGVGYPSGINLVFSAEQLCLAMVWPGEFADPAGVWTSQGHGTVRPLSRERVDFTNAPELALLDQVDSPWPVEEGRPADFQFLGYVLDDQRRPTFRYRFGSTTVEDGFTDLRTGGLVSLKRTLSFRSSEADTRLVFRVASKSGLKAKAANQFQLGPLEISISGRSPATLLEAADAQEIRVPVQLSGGTATLVVEYAWPSAKP